MWRGAKDCLRDMQGAAVIEFAILTPVFLLMMAGMLAYGIYFGTAHAVQQLSADAVRVAVAGLTPNESAVLVEDYIKRNAAAYMFVDETRLTRRVYAVPGDPTQIRLELRYDATSLPIWNLYPPLPLPSTSIVKNTTIRRSVL